MVSKIPKKLNAEITGNVFNNPTLIIGFRQHSAAADKRFTIQLRQDANNYVIASLEESGNKLLYSRVSNGEVVKQITFSGTAS